MGKFEKLKTFVGYVKEYLKKKKEEREVTYMQSRGSSILKNTSFMDHPYMQKTSQKVVNDTAKLKEAKSVLSKIREM
jgi:hypothetical protein